MRQWGVVLALLVAFSLVVTVLPAQAAPPTSKPTPGKKPKPTPTATPTATVTPTASPTPTASQTLCTCQSAAMEPASEPNLKPIAMTTGGSALMIDNVGERIVAMSLVAAVAIVWIVTNPSMGSKVQRSRVVPATAGACSGAANTPGGPDPWGGCFPGPNNTGVPAGTSLTTYSGSCTITTPNTTIDSKTVNCPLSIQAANVTIIRSKVNGNVMLDTDLGGSSSWTLNVTDSEIDAGEVDLPGICCGHWTILRTNMHNGHNGAQCDLPDTQFCNMTDSWIHGQYQPQDFDSHLGGFLSDGGTGINLTHNTVACDAEVNPLGGGCSGNINFIPNFGPIDGATVYRNLLVANADMPWCTLGGEKTGFSTPSNLQYIQNVFQKADTTPTHSTNVCAEFGPVTDWNSSRPGNLWSGNIWDDGSPVPDT